MFQFTTTNVINSNTDTENKDKKVWYWHNGFNALMVKGVGTFKPNNVKSITKASAVSSEPSVLTLDLTNVQSVDEGDTLRLSIYVRLGQASQSSYHANDYQYKGRPFTIEFPWLEDAATTVENLKKIIKKYGLFVFEKELFNVTVNGNKLILTSKDEFQRFHSYKLEQFVESKEQFGEVWENITGAITVTEGREGFGDYGWVLRNLRLPTCANNRAFSPMAHEMPIPGAKYTQVTIEYCANRGPLGLNAVGQDVQSVTTHVFFINEDLIDNDEQILAGLNGLVSGAKLQWQTGEHYDYTVVKPTSSQD